MVHDRRMQIEFVVEEIDSGDAHRLAQAMREELAAVYPGLDLDGPEMPKAGPGELGPPGGEFIVGRVEGQAICCGGFKRLPDGACEIKRMYVAPQARGRGVARALLHELERRARSHGSGSRASTPVPSSPARRLYEAEELPGDDELQRQPGRDVLRREAARARPASAAVPPALGGPSQDDKKNVQHSPFRRRPGLT